MQKMKGVVIGVIGALVLAAGAAAPQFEEVPSGANKYLKAVRGKPIRTGMVFVNGHYQKPPYVLMRSGTALFLNNGTQITGQIVPWKAFLATQSGGAAVFAPPPAPSAPVRPRTVQPRTVQSVDDLFDDTPPPEPEPAAPTPAPAAPSATASETAAAIAALESSFTPNEQTRLMLKRINDRRSYFDRKLREGNVIFFGTRYSPVTVDTRLVRSLLAVLPEAIREANDGAQLFAMLRGKGIAYLSREVCDDLVENRADYPQILEYRRAIEKDEELKRLLDPEFPIRR